MTVFRYWDVLRQSKREDLRKSKQLIYEISGLSPALAQRRLRYMTAQHQLSQEILAWSIAISIDRDYLTTLGVLVSTALENDQFDDLYAWEIATELLEDESEPVVDEGKRIVDHLLTKNYGQDLDGLYFPLRDFMQNDQDGALKLVSDIAKTAPEVGRRLGLRLINDFDEPDTWNPYSITGQLSTRKVIRDEDAVRLAALAPRA